MFEGILAATADNTRQSYGAGCLRSTQFCDAELIPESLRMPASSTLLAAFVAEYVGTRTGECIRNWLRLWHIFNHADWHGKEDWLPYLLKAAEKKGVIFKRPPRGPVTREHLLTLKSHLTLSRPRDAALWAAATSAFWGCCRLGELLVASGGKFTLEHDVTRLTRISRSVVNGCAVIMFHLPWTKTTGVKGGECILTATGDKLCPILSLDNHFLANGRPESSTPFFSYKDGGNWTYLTKPAFLSFITAIFKQHNLEHVFGHSFRIGGSLIFLMLGIAPEIIMKIGGWTSLCFLIYWRRLEQIKYSSCYIKSLGLTYQRLRCIE